MSLFSSHQPLSEETKLFWASLDILRDKNIDLFFDFFGDLETARKNISAQTLEKVGIPKRSITGMIKKLNALDLESIKKIQEKFGIKILYREEELFPSQLKTIPDAPIFLFYRGEITRMPKVNLAVVGSRAPSTEGKWALEYLLDDIAQSNVGIISGLAQGIDALAHKNALKNNGFTAAFCGTGLDTIYPAINKSLYEEIAEKGVLFSEFPFGTPPLPYNFPRRNRLVSGFSNAVFVVEGKKKSGSLITADFALEQGKDVLALPGNIKSALAEGPNILIQQGAQLVLSSQDILDVLGMKAHIPEEKKNIDPVFANPDEKKVYELLSYSSVSFDDLIQKTKFTSAHLSATLMMMSLQNIVGEVGNGFWVRR